MLNDGDVDKLVKAAAEFGNGKIHIIVNNAGFTWDAVIHKVGDCSPTSKMEAESRTAADRSS